MVLGGQPAPVATLRSPEAAFREVMIDKAVLDRPEIARATDALVAKEARQAEFAMRMKEGKKHPMFALLDRELANDRQAVEALKTSLRPVVERQVDALLAVRRNDQEDAAMSRLAGEAQQLRSELVGAMSWISI